MTENVVVIGGGYAGVLAANRLARDSRTAVTLINPRPSFVERIRLHQLVAGTHPASTGFDRVLSPKVRLLVDTATRIDAPGRAVELASGGAAEYDYLVYAIGSAGTPAPGAAYSIATWEDAQRLRAALHATDGPVTVVGGGATGVETAAELAERGRTVTLVCGGVLNPYLHPSGRKVVAGQLARLGVTVLENVKVSSATAGAVQLADGGERPSAVTIWTTGFVVPDLAARSGLSTDAIGRLRTDDTLTSVDDSRVVAAGDCLVPSDRPFRMSCQAAGQLGRYAPRTVLARIGGRQPKPVSLYFAGQCLSLGRRSGLVQMSGLNDGARGWYLRGGAAARVKEFVCRGTVSQLTRGSRG
ncbi:NAD(P)/FAD-dependent oxidoreductase [Actinoplanes sp. DH11]|uniref:NAD(P)/FAD-dependent oxidoreductase n=1 Tax=Actinoplanes sp. DH11 TaxID=2857011 RepID=UPI001E31E739|nr:FAD-dependent oxidoreductase [Actinoplanes sp. DH11]